MMDIQQKIQQKISYISNLGARQRYAMPIPQDMLDDDGAWLAVTSKDWSLLTSEKIRQHGKKIKGILALDDTMVVIAIECGLCYMLWEDFMDFDNFKDIHQKIIDDLTTWYKEFIFYYTDENNIVWPEVDQDALIYLWNDIAYMQCFELKMLEKNISLIVIKQEPFLPTLYYYSSDNFGRMCAELINQKISYITVCSNKNIDSLNISTPGTLLLIDTKNKVFLGLNSGEFYRAREFIKQLDAKYGNDFVLASLTPYKNTHFENVPVAPFYHHKNKYDTQLFVNAWKHLRENVTVFPKKFRQHILKTLYWYHTTRWPMLKSRVENLISQFKISQPSCVMGSTLSDCESQIAIIAANIVDIPTVTFGHAFGSTLNLLHAFASKKVLIGTKYSYNFSINKGMSPSSLAPISNYPLKYLFNVEHKISQYFKTNKFRIFVLPSSTRLNGCASLFSNLRISAKNLFEIIHVPCDLKNNVEIRFKGHPWLCDRAPAFMMNIDEEIFFIPKSNDIQEIIQESDLCVSLNYDTCGFYFAATQRPTALIMNDSIYISRQYNPISNKIYNNCFFDIGALWNFIRFVFKNPDKREEVVEKQKQCLVLDKNTTRDWLSVVHEQVVTGLQRAANI